MSEKNYLCQRILLTNDDGISAPGLEILRTIAAELAPEVWIVAPAEEKSGASQSVSLHRTIICVQSGQHEYAVTGSPADCVALVCAELMRDCLPDLLLSGINRGGNLGNETVFSGTVGAAMTGLLFSIPSIALSQNTDAQGTAVWETARKTGAETVRTLFRAGWPSDACLSVNFPAIPPEKAGPLMVTTQGTGCLNGFVVNKLGDEGTGRFTCNVDLRHSGCESDLSDETTAIAAGYIAVTPLKYNRTHMAGLERLQHALR
ncbi:TPA: 5'/3'-nucleotidase SurE [Klebsiella pneumoniae]|nr:5'/3'-nucleotidase SurE [Klebsiella pneumoniae]